VGVLEHVVERVHEVVHLLLAGDQRGSSLTTFMLSPATWVKILCRWNRGPTTSWEKSPLRAPSIIFQRDFNPKEVGSRRRGR